MVLDLECGKQNERWKWVYRGSSMHAVDSNGKVLLKLITDSEGLTTIRPYGDLQYNLKSDYFTDSTYIDLESAAKAAEKTMNKHYEYYSLGP
jgi:hypothetical protein